MCNCENALWNWGLLVVNHRENKEGGIEEGGSGNGGGKRELQGIAMGGGGGGGRRDPLSRGCIFSLTHIPCFLL